MSYYDLTDELREVEIHHRKKLFEATTMDAVSFLPGRLGMVKARFKELVRKKARWGLEILEDVDSRDIRIEDVLRITVQNEHWEEFQSTYIKDAELDLTLLLDEAMEDDIHDLHRELKAALHQSFNSPQCAQIEQHHAIWYGRFGVKDYKSDKIVVTCEKEERDIQALYGELLKSYGDDRGAMEMLIEDLTTGRAASGEVFQEYDYMYGTVMVSEGGPSKINVVFEGLLDMGFIPSESVYIGSDEALDAVENQIRNVKRVGNIVYPAGEVFEASFFGTLHHIISDVQ